MVRVIDTMTGVVARVSDAQAAALGANWVPMPASLGDLPARVRATLGLKPAVKPEAASAKASTGKKLPIKGEAKP